MDLLRARLLAVCLAPSACGLAVNYLDVEGPRYAGRHANPSAAGDGRITVASFNLEYGRLVEEAAREIETDPSLRQADLLLLQEMDAEGVDRLARALHYDYVYYPASIHPNTGRDFGNAILSKGEILEDEKLVLPHANPKNGQRRTAVRARAATELGVITAYSAHTETPWLGLEGRLEQARAIASSAVLDPDPCVVAGDFNTAEPGSLDQTVSLFEEVGFSWASRPVGDTASLGPFSAAVDHVFARGLEVAGAGKAASTAASDHLPMWVIFQR